MKYIARQINPAYQQSPMWFDFNKDFYKNLFIIPSDRCCGINEKELNDFVNLINDCVSDFENSFTYNSYYANLTELLKFEIYGGNKPNTHTVHKWRKLFEDWDDRDTDKICEALSLAHEIEYDYTSISGCCQGDYAEVIYFVDEWSESAIEALEIEYFNLGTEWIFDENGIDDAEFSEMIENEEFDADNYGDICVYVYSWRHDDMRKELADAIGCNVEDVVMCEYDGCININKYKVI